MTATAASTTTSAAAATSSMGSATSAWPSMPTVPSAVTWRAGSVTSTAPSTTTVPATSTVSAGRTTSAWPSTRMSAAAATWSIGSVTATSPAIASTRPVHVKVWVMRLSAAGVLADEGELDLVAGVDDVEDAVQIAGHTIRQRIGAGRVDTVAVEAGVVHRAAHVHRHPAGRAGGRHVRAIVCAEHVQVAADIRDAGAGAGDRREDLGAFGRVGAPGVIAGEGGAVGDPSSMEPEDDGVIRVGQLIEEPRLLRRPQLGLARVVGLRDRIHRSFRPSVKSSGPRPQENAKYVPVTGRSRRGDPTLR